MYRAAFTLSVVGALLLVIAICLPLVFPMLFESLLNKKLIIKPDTEMEKSFRDTPVPIYLQIYFMNITNEHDVLLGAKPNLDQVGPYTYRQRRQRVDVHWNDEMGTVLFKSRKFYYFEPSLSIGPETDLITTVNPVYLTLASKISADSIPDAMRSVAQLLFHRFDSNPFMTHPVKELLFQGYDEPLLGHLYKVTKDPDHKLAKTGYFYPRNGTTSGEIEIFSGQLGMSNYQHILKYDGAEILDYWKEERCNMINGTDGAQFSRPIRKSQPVYLFTAELCRSIYAVYEKDVRLGPLTLHRFVLPRSLLDNSEENSCYCSSNFTCRAGMIDVSPCRKGAPVVISTPHFYQGDTVDQNSVVGLNPLKDEHETYIDIEPSTGVALRVAKRIQINMALKRYGNLPPLSSVPEIIVPILWINESVVVPMAKVEKLNKALTNPLKIVTYGSWALLGIGILMVIIASCLTYRTFKKGQKLQKKRQQGQDSKVHGNNIKLLEKNNLHQVS